MKKVFYPFVLLLAASVIFTGCRDDEQHGDGSQTTSASITTTSPWTSSVRETTGTRTTAEATASTRSTVDWLTFSPQSGGAGTHTITINLTANRTGADRSAVITIESEELDIEISVTQRYVPRGGDLGPYSVALTIEDAFRYTYVQRFAFFVFGGVIRPHFHSTPHRQNLYYELDNQFSTLTSRAPFSPPPQIPPGDGPFNRFWLSDQFWGNSYQTIRQAYLFLTTIPEMLETHSDAANIERVFLEHKGGVLASKGLMYFYLNTKFGGVPILTEWDNPYYLPSRASWSEVSEFVRKTIHEGLSYLNSGQNRAPWDYEFIALSYRTLALIALQKQEYRQALGYLQQSIGVLSNMHTLTYLFRYAEMEMLISTNLLYAETLLKIGQSAQAIARVNQVLQGKGKELLPSDATDDEVFAAIQATFPDKDTGVKYINAVRWGTWGAEWDETWGAKPPTEFGKFLPIPQSAIWNNPNLVQNPGWWY